jgi:hypothetical protein
MKTYTPKNTEIFHLSASDFLTAGEGDWRAERLAEEVTTPAPEDGEDSTEYDEEREAEAEKLAGFYWWTCCPGCLPDSEASGPFETEEEANEDAGGGEYEDHIIALAEELGEDPADITEESRDCYGMTVLSCGRAEYAVGTDEEADEAWDQSLDSYLDDCGVLDSMPENLRPYFDREAWKRDARFDGRGHSLASYDGNEMDLSDGFVAFRIN